MSQDREFHRIKESIIAIRHISQVKPLENWIKLFEKYYDDSDDANNLRQLLRYRIGFGYLYVNS